MYEHIMAVLLFFPFIFGYTFDMVFICAQWAVLFGMGTTMLLKPTGLQVYV